MNKSKAVFLCKRCIFHFSTLKHLNYTACFLWLTYDALLTYQPVFTVTTHSSPEFQKQRWEDVHNLARVYTDSVTETGN